MTIHHKLYPAKPYHRRYAQPLPPLLLSGDFPDYTPGVDYEGRIGIVDPIGRCRVRLLAGNLPDGYQLFVDNIAKQVVLRWPASAQEETRTGFPNGDFEQGQASWTLPTGWAVETVPYGSNPNNKALVYRGAGSGKARSVFFPLSGLPLINFSGLWHQGPSNKDNVDLYTNLLFRNEQGVESRVPGSKVGGMSNKFWHTSSGSASPTAGATQVAVELEVFRRNSRDREVMVDNVTWTLSYPVTVPQGEYPLSLEVTDSAGRIAVWSGTIYPPRALVFQWYVSGEVVGTASTFYRRVPSITDLEVFDLDVGGRGFICAGHRDVGLVSANPSNQSLYLTSLEGDLVQQAPLAGAQRQQNYFTRVYGDIVEFPMRRGVSRWNLSTNEASYFIVDTNHTGPASGCVFVNGMYYAVAGTGWGGGIIYQSENLEGPFVEVLNTHDDGVAYAEIQASITTGENGEVVAAFAVGPQVRLYRLVSGGLSWERHILPNSAGGDTVVVQWAADRYWLMRRGLPTSVWSSETFGELLTSSKQLVNGDYKAMHAASDNVILESWGTDHATSIDGGATFQLVDDLGLRLNGACPVLI